MRFLLLLSLLIACDSPRVQQATAQPAGPAGLPRVWVVDGGLCTGYGTTGHPLNCTPQTDTTIAGTGSAGAPLTASIEFDGGYFCDGSDGTVTFDGTTAVLGMTPSSGVYTMARDICCHNCTIDAAATVQGGWRFFDNGTLTLNGKIARNGSNGGNGSTTSGAAGAGAVGTGAWFSAASAGGAGNTTAAGSIGNNCNAPTELCTTGSAAAGVAGAACGGGGGGAGGSAGGVGGSANQIAGRLQDLRSIIGALDGLQSHLNTNLINCGAGGGGGGGVTGFAGGGGGGGGGYTFVGAKRFAGTGTVEAKGGNGGNGNAGGNTGGGGGGGGGIIVLLVGFGSFPTAIATGGTGGTPGGTGTAGGAGGTGRVIQLRMGS